MKLSFQHIKHELWLATQCCLHELWLATQCCLLPSKSCKHSHDSVALRTHCLVRANSPPHRVECHHNNVSVISERIPTARQGQQRVLLINVVPEENDLLLQMQVLHFNAEHMLCPLYIISTYIFSSHSKLAPR